MKKRRPAPEQWPPEVINEVLLELEKDDAAVVAAHDHLTHCESTLAAITDRRRRVRNAIAALSEIDVDELIASVKAGG